MLGWDITYPNVNNEIINLDWILKKIKEFETKLDAWQVLAEELQKALDGIGEMQNEITALQNDVADLQNLRTSISNLEGEIRSLQIEVNSQERDIASLKQSFDSIDIQFDAVYQRIASEVTLLNQKIASLTIDIENDFNEKFFALKRVIEAIKKELDLIDTTLINPWHQEMGKTSPDVNNKLIYADLADECLTAEEYLKLGFSADDYKSYNLSAISYAKFGKEKLHFRYVFMPLIGKKQEISVALDSIINNIMGTMTASDYAGLDMDADTYAALDITAGEYIILPLNPPGLTADDYAALGNLNSGLIFNFS